MVIEVRMKKLLSLIIVCLIAVLFLSACDSNVPERDKISYEIKAELNDKILTCSQKTEVKNVYKEGLDSIVFALYPNAYADGVENPAYTAKPSSFGKVDIKKISVDGEVKTGEYNEDKTYVTVSMPAKALDESVVIDIDYEVTIPECDLRLGFNDGYYNISNFYPQVTVFENDKFRADAFSTVGDPVFSPLADFKMEITLPSTSVIAAPGEVTEINNGSKKTVGVVLSDARDAAFVIKDDYKVIEKDVDGVAVKYYYVEDEDAQGCVDTAAKAIEVFSEAFGAYPYKTFIVASTPFKEGGMEFSGLVYISDNNGDKKGTIIHETAHQWFYNLVGNDNINAAYLDEGLTTYCAEYYYLLTGDEDKYKENMADIEQAYLRYERIQRARGDKGLLSVTEPIRKYTSYQYTMLVYYKTALLFKNIYDMGDKEKFNASIRSYVENNRFGVADKEKLISAFNEGMKCDVSGIINGYLSEGTVVATFAR